MDDINVISGTPSLVLKDVAHLLVPGRGRSGNGDNLTEQSIDRTKWAAHIYKRLGLQSRGGVIVVTGYKSPGDTLGSNPSDPKYFGIPEADLMKQLLILEGIPQDRIRVERDSIDSVTNLVLSEYGGCFPDRRPVAVVAQEKHLKRIIKIIAPKVLKRGFLGFIVPEDQLHTDKDSKAAWIASYLILLGLTPHTKNLESIVQRRAALLWKVIGTLHLVKNYNIQK